MFPGHQWDFVSIDSNADGALASMGLCARAREFFSREGTSRLLQPAAKVGFCCEAFCGALLLGPASLGVSLSSSDLARSGSASAEEPVGGPVLLRHCLLSHSTQELPRSSLALRSEVPS